jgi:hypothetical protein
MKRTWLLVLPALEAQAIEVEWEEPIDNNTVVEYYLQQLEQHPEQYMDELYTTMDVILDIEPTIVYSVAAQYWQDDFRESLCEQYQIRRDCRQERDTLTYTTLEPTDSKTETKLDAIVAGEGFPSIAARVNQNFAADPIANMGHMYLATTIAMRHAPNGTYLQGCRSREEDFVEDMHAMSYALERMANEGFDYSHDLNYDE